MPPVAQKSALALTLLALLVAPAFSGCTAAPDVDVLATFYPLGFLSQRIAGEDVTVGVIVPEGTDPHDWEHSPRDLQRLGSARLVVAQGLGFEPWLDGAVRAVGDRAPLVVRTADDLDEDHLPWGDEHDDRDGHGHASGHDDEDTHDDDHPDGHNETHDDDHPEGHNETHDDEGDGHGHGDGHDHGDEDPHTWLDPALFAQQAERIRDAMTMAFPEHAAGFEARTVALLADLDEMHHAYEERLDECRLDLIITQHDAFGRLAERYDLRTAAPSGLDPEAEPAIQRMHEVIGLVRDNDIGIVFTEPGADDRIMRNIADETGATVEPLHHLEGRTQADRAAGADWTSLMHDNLDRLARALECD